MRNVYDQYSQPENRVTHALMTSLNADRTLLKAVLQWLKVKAPVKAEKLQLAEQTIVGQPEVGEDEAEKRGLPDGWIHDDNEWCLLIESKISSRLTLEQVKRHYRTAERCGFTHITVLAIEVYPSTLKCQDWLQRIQWVDIYRFLAKQSESYWAQQTLRYMDIAEAQFTESGYLKEGNLTVFTGIHFDQTNPYNYPEAKRYLRLMLEAIRADREFCKQAKINPDMAGRGAITGSKSSAVWDFLPFFAMSEGSSFTSYPHFTLGINNKRLHISVTLPNSLKTEYRNRLRALKTDEFEQLAADIVENMQPQIKEDPGYRPWCTAVQRRYPSQRSQPIHDAVIEFDLRTAVGDSNKKVKPQPQWLVAAFEAYCEKRSNYQLQLGAIIEFELSTCANSEQVIEQIKQTWLACQPFLKPISHST